MAVVSVQMEALPDRRASLFATPRHALLSGSLPFQPGARRHSTAVRLGLTPERFNLTTERLSLTAVNLDLTAVRCDLTVERFNLTMERLSLTAVNLDLTAVRFGLTVERLNLTMERLSLTVVKLDLTVVRFDLTAERFNLTRKRLSLTAAKSLLLRINALRLAQCSSDKKTAGVGVTADALTLHRADGEAGRPVEARVGLFCSSERACIRDAGEPAGRILVGPHRASLRVGHGDRVFHVGQGSVEHPELVVDGSAVEDLHD